MLYNDIRNIVVTLGRITPNGINLLGTAFLINKPGHFVTAAHTIRNDDKGLVIILNNVYDGYQDTADTKVKYIKAEAIQLNPYTDLCILKTETDIQCNLSISGSDNVNVGDDVILFGFPHANHGRKVLTQQNTEVGAKVLIDSSGIKNKHIILNIQSRPGQSGSPIINKSNLNIVGVLLGSYAPTSQEGISIGGIDPQTLHQTTHAISSEYIKEMI